MPFEDQPLTSFPRIDAEIGRGMSPSHRVQAIATIVLVMAAALVIRWLSA